MIYLSIFGIKIKIIVIDYKTLYSNIQLCHFLLYLRYIYINTYLFKSTYKKVLIILSCIIFKWNLTINIRNICKNIIAKILA